VTALGYSAEAKLFNYDEPFSKFAINYNLRRNPKAIAEKDKELAAVMAQLVASQAAAAGAAAAEAANELSQAEAVGVLSTRTRPALNRQTESAHRYENST